MEIADSDGGVAQPIDLPGNGIQEPGPAEPDGERLERIEHRAGEHEGKVEDAGDAVKNVVAADSQSKDRIKEKPAHRARGHPRGKQREFLPLKANAQPGSVYREGEGGLSFG